MNYFILVNIIFFQLCLIVKSFKEIRNLQKDLILSYPSYHNQDQDQGLDYIGQKSTDPINTNNIKKMNDDFFQQTSEYNLKQSNLRQQPSQNRFIQLSNDKDSRNEDDNENGDDDDGDDDDDDDDININLFEEKNAIQDNFYINENLLNEESIIIQDIISDQVFNDINNEEEDQISIDNKIDQNQTQICEQTYAPPPHSIRVVKLQQEQINQESKQIEKHAQLLGNISQEAVYKIFGQIINLGADEQYKTLNYLVQNYQLAHNEIFLNELMRYVENDQVKLSKIQIIQILSVAGDDNLTQCFDSKNNISNIEKSDRFDDELNSIKQLIKNMIQLPANEQIIALEYIIKNTNLSTNQFFINQLIKYIENDSLMIDKTQIIQIFSDQKIILGDQKIQSINLKRRSPTNQLKQMVDDYQLNYKSINIRQIKTSQQNKIEQSNQTTKNKMGSNEETNDYANTNEQDEQINEENMKTPLQAKKKQNIATNQNNEEVNDEKQDQINEEIIPYQEEINNEMNENEINTQRMKNFVGTEEEQNSEDMIHEIFDGTQTSNEETYIDLNHIRSRNQNSNKETNNQDNEESYYNQFDENTEPIEEQNDNYDDDNDTDEEQIYNYDENEGSEEDSIQNDYTYDAMSEENYNNYDDQISEEYSNNFDDDDENYNFNGDDDSNEDGDDSDEFNQESSKNIYDDDETSQEVVNQKQISKGRKKGMVPMNKMKQQSSQQQKKKLGKRQVNNKMTGQSHDEMNYINEENYNYEISEEILPKQIQYKNKKQDNLLKQNKLNGKKNNISEELDKGGNRLNNSQNEQNSVNVRKYEQNSNKKGGQKRQFKKIIDAEDDQNNFISEDEYINHQPFYQDEIEQLNEYDSNQYLYGEELTINVQDNHKQQVSKYKYGYEEEFEYVDIWEEYSKQDVIDMDEIYYEEYRVQQDEDYDLRIQSVDKEISSLKDNNQLQPTQQKGQLKLSIVATKPESKQISPYNDKVEVRNKIPQKKDEELMKFLKERGIMPDEIMDETEEDQIVVEDNDDFVDFMRQRIQNQFNQDENQYMENERIVVQKPDQPNQIFEKNNDPIDIDEYIGDIQYQSKDIMDSNPDAIGSNDVFVLYSLASSSQNNVHRMEDIVDIDKERENLRRDAMSPSGTDKTGYEDKNYDRWEASRMNSEKITEEKTLHTTHPEFIPDPLQPPKQKIPNYTPSTSKQQLIQQAESHINLQSIRCKENYKGALKQAKNFVCQSCNAEQAFILDDDSWYMIGMIAINQQQFQEFLNQMRLFLKSQLALLSFGQEIVCIASESINVPTNITQIIRYLNQQNKSISNTSQLLKMPDQMILQYIQVIHSPSNNLKFQNVKIQATQDVNKTYHQGLQISSLGAEIINDIEIQSFSGYLNFQKDKIQFSLTDRLGSQSRKQNLELKLYLPNDLSLLESISNNYFADDLQNQLIQYIKWQEKEASYPQYYKLIMMSEHSPNDFEISFKLKQFDQ